YAGAHQLPRMLEAMRANGWAGDDEAVIVYNGTLTSQESFHGTIDALLEQVHEHPRKGPAILVVGRVVGFREHIRWFDARPLFGKRVLVTRPRDQAAEMVARLTVLGAEAIEAPMIRIVPPEDDEPLKQAARDVQLFDWIVFTSANAVDAFMTALLEVSHDIRALAGPQIATVGSGTAERLARYRIRVDLVPDEFRAEAVVAALEQHGRIDGARVLIPRADIGRDVI